MSIPLSAQAPAVVHSVGVDEVRGPTRLVRGWSEPQDGRDQTGLAYRDVDNEVRIRMARRGYHWE